MKPNVFVLLSTCMEVSISLLCLLVHEPLYQTVAAHCDSVFCHSSSRMDHHVHTIFNIRVGLTQAHPNEHYHISVVFNKNYLLYGSHVVLHVTKEATDCVIHKYIGKQVPNNNQ